MFSSLKHQAKQLLLTSHVAAEWLHRRYPSATEEPFLCVITPVFDGAIESVKLLVQDLQRQSFSDFLVVFISNGPSPKIKRYVATLSLSDARFVFEARPFTPTKDYRVLLANLGRRREYALKKYVASRYVFLDADLKLLDVHYFAKLYMADLLTHKPVICTQVVVPGPQKHILPIFPIQLGRIDMANFSFSRELAQTMPYPTDYDPTYGIGNDYRFFKSINQPNNTLFLECVSAEKNGHATYTTISNRVETTSSELVSVFGNYFDGNETTAVDEVLQSHLVGRGAITDTFERRFKDLIGFPHAAAVHSCTNGFWLLLQALHFQPDHEVIIPNIHFYGIKNVLELLRIPYRLADVAPVIPNTSLEYIKPLITRKTKAIIFLEFGGYPQEIAPIKQYLKQIHRLDIKLILDAANSPFTRFQGKATALAYDFAVYSFDMNKILVTGDGGMILSRDENTINRIKTLANWGINHLAKTGYERSATSDRWWETTVEYPGLNLNMNNIAAAIGLQQLPKVSAILKRRQQVEAYYRKELRGLAMRKLLSLPPRPSQTKDYHYLFWLQLTTEKTRDALAAYLLERRIFSTVRYQPLVAGADTPHAHAFYQTSLCLPLHQNLTHNQLSTIVTTIKEFFES